MRRTTRVCRTTRARRWPCTYARVGVAPAMLWPRGRVGVPGAREITPARQRWVVAVNCYCSTAEKQIEKVAFAL